MRALPILRQLHKTEDGQAPSPAPTPTPTQTQGPTLSKLSELASSITAAQSAVEAEAAQALARLNAARDNAKASISKVDGVSAAIEKATKDIENFTNQLTNGGPL